VEVFAGDFTDGITEGFKLAAPYSDVIDSPSELPTTTRKSDNINGNFPSAIFTDENNSVSNSVEISVQ